MNDTVIEIYTGTLWEAEMIKSLLESANIFAFLKNTLLNTYAFGAVPSQGVKVMISSNDFEQAQILVKEYLENKDRVDNL